VEQANEEVAGREPGGIKGRKNTGSNSEEKGISVVKIKKFEGM